MQFYRAKRPSDPRIDQVEENYTCFSSTRRYLPLCETQLGEEGQKLLQTKYNNEKTVKIELINTSQAELKQKEAEVRAQESDISQFEVKLKRSLQTTLGKMGNLSKALSDAREAADKINLEKRHRDEIEQRLAKRDFAVSEQEALGRIEKEIATIGYDSRNMSY
jgi:hypothetical protein